MLWDTSKAKPNIDYIYHLCQSNEGKRYLQVAEHGSQDPIDSIFRTQIIPPSLLGSRSLLKISRELLLEDLSSFCIESHGAWLTEAEALQLRHSHDFSNIKWSTPTPPIFVRK